MKEPEELREQDPVEELLAAYALNAVEPHERAVVELILAQDNRYQAVLAQYLEAAATLSGAYAYAVPSAALRQRVLDTVRFRPAAPAQTHRRGGDDGGFLVRVSTRLWFAAGILLALVAGLVGYGAYQQFRVERLEDQLVSTQQLVTQQEGVLTTTIGEQQRLADQVLAEIGWTQQQLVIARAALYWAALPGVETVVLEPASPVGETRGASPRAMFMITPDEEGGLLIAVGLPPTDAGTAYQAWLWYKEGTAINGGVFSPDSSGYVQVFVPMKDDLSSYRAITITTEPMEGSPAPTSPALVEGSMAIFSEQ